jgi:osmotically-inducible protein OsmY
MPRKQNAQERNVMHKPNNLLENDVMEELDWDPLLDDTRIIVKADDGQVTLSGSVYTYYESGLAEADAARIGGVTLVENQLMVGLTGEAVADADIATAAATALQRDRFVPDSVDVAVTDGWVTLNGEVRRHIQRQAAQHAVGRVDGVLGVANDIVLTSDPIPGDVADRINRAFKRNAIIDDSLIDVTNQDHTIYLDGTVGSWTAMDQAVETAWEAPGVGDVVNRLVVVP